MNCDRCKSESPTLEIGSTTAPTIHICTPCLADLARWLINGRVCTAQMLKHYIEGRADLIKA